MNTNDTDTAALVVTLDPVDRAYVFARAQTEGKRVGRVLRELVMAGIRAERERR